MGQKLIIKLQVRLPLELSRRLELACQEWSPKGVSYTPSDVVRLVLEERLPRPANTNNRE